MASHGLAFEGGTGSALSDDGSGYAGPCSSFPMTILVDRGQRRDVLEQLGLDRVHDVGAHRRLISYTEPDLDDAALIERREFFHSRLPCADQFDDLTVAERFGAHLEIAARTLRVFVPILGLLKIMRSVTCHCRSHGAVSGCSFFMFG